SIGPAADGRGDRVEDARVVSGAGPTGRTKLDAFTLLEVATTGPCDDDGGRVGRVRRAVAEIIVPNSYPVVEQALVAKAVEVELLQEVGERPGELAVDLVVELIRTGDDGPGCVVAAA